MGTQCFVHGASQGSLGLLQDVTHALVESLNCLGRCHVSILTYLANASYDVNVLT